MRSLLFLLVLVVSPISVVNAAIIGGAVTGGYGYNNGIGDFFELDVSNVVAVGNNTYQDYNLYAFTEAAGINLANDIFVDDLFLGGSSSGAGLLPSGTFVDIHYIFYDAIDFNYQQGYVDFSEDIVGVIWETDHLSSTDYLVASNGVDYLNPTLRGLESHDDLPVVDANLRRINLSWKASNPGDYIRVLTLSSSTNSINSVPEPGSLALVAFGILGVACARRRKEHLVNSKHL